MVLSFTDLHCAVLFVNAILPEQFTKRSRTGSKPVVSLSYICHTHIAHPSDLNHFNTSITFDTCSTIDASCLSKCFNAE